MDGGASLLLLLGTGALILRPHDIPVMARFVGRAVGATVRSLRLAKNAAEDVIAENVKNAKDPNSELGMVGRGLRDSLSKFDSLTAAVRKDMADVPLSPRMWIQKGVRALDRTDQGEHQHKQQRSDPDSARASEVQHAEQWRDYGGEMQAPVSRKPIHINTMKNNSSGVDFIARAIEEAALAQQQKRVFASPLHSKEQPNFDRPTKDGT